MTTTTAAPLPSAWPATLHPTDLESGHRILPANGHSSETAVVLLLMLVLPLRLLRLPLNLLSLPPLLLLLLLLLPLLPSSLPLPPLLLLL